MVNAGVLPGRFYALWLLHQTGMASGEIDKKSKTAIAPGKLAPIASLKKLITLKTRNTKYDAS